MYRQFLFGDRFNDEKIAVLPSAQFVAEGGIIFFIVDENDVCGCIDAKFRSKVSRRVAVGRRALKYAGRFSKRVLCFKATHSYPVSADADN